ncbi:beta-defensin 134 [Nycticebus coucang]|uniref:beta-defensin 134 n=1 Tax=Nycticebus coucang TaxID=9470 RepID=UPI00234DEEA2|nr:beta-defensin 134 [Nycticebus coucang]
MKTLLVLFVVLFLWDPVTAGFNLISPEVHKKCYKGGICRLECYRSEMLVAYCMFHLECCLTGRPPP